MRFFHLTLLCLIPALVYSRECPGVTVMDQLSLPFSGQWYFYETATIGNRLKSGGCGLLDPSPACKCHAVQILHPNENIPASYIINARALNKGSSTYETGQYSMKKYRTGKFVYYGKVGKTKVSINVIGTDNFRTWAAWVICSKDATIYIAATRMPTPDKNTVNAVRNAFRTNAARANVQWQRIDHNRCARHE